MLADNEIDIRMKPAWRSGTLLAVGSGRSRHHGIIHGQGVLLRSDFPNRRSLRSGARRPGVTGETLVARIFNEVRGFRIYDGPSEVHRWSLAQKINRDGANW